MAKLLIKSQTRHGFHGSDVYKLWSSIVKRCENKTSSNYKYYGAVGVSVCDEWRLSPKSFCEWALENGYKNGITIDRIDRNKGYEPKNCKFIPHSENCGAGKRSNKSNKTGYIGVSKSRTGSYEVYVTINKKQTYLGVRKTIEDAVTLRDNHNPEYKKQESITSNIHQHPPQHG